MISFKMFAKGACLAAVLAFGANNAEAKKYKHYGSSGSSSSHGSSGSSSSHGSSGSSSSHGSSGSSSSHGSSGSSSSHGSSGSSSSHGKSGSSSSHGSSGSSSSHGSSGSSSSHGHVIIHTPVTTTSARVQPATLLVKVPADATVYLMDQKMTLTGTERQYSIPVRQAGVDFTYNIRVEVVRDGKTLVSRSEQKVRAGQQYEVAVTEAVEDGELVAVAGR
ncbi:MAG: TIGR03000 domain-containing protein [Planctomycetota bacterium]